MASSLRAMRPGVAAKVRAGASFGGQDCQSQKLPCPDRSGGGWHVPPPTSRSGAELLHLWTCRGDDIGAARWRLVGPATVSEREEGWVTKTRWVPPCSRLAPPPFCACRRRHVHLVSVGRVGACAEAEVEGEARWGTRPPYPRNNAHPLLQPPQSQRPVAARAAADRPVWFPGNPPPAYLDGTLPGDYGFDPLRLGSDPDTLKWFAQAELIHGRVAMTAAAGILIPAVATKAGGIGAITEFPEWFESNKVFQESHQGYPFAANAFVTLLLSGWVETKRLMDIRNPGSQGDGSFLGVTTEFESPKGTGYPGGRFFDPLGMADSPQFEELKVKEIKNGRLAMLAMLGFDAAYKATGKGPIDALIDHIKTGASFATNGVSLPLYHPQ